MLGYGHSQPTGAPARVFLSGGVGFRARLRALTSEQGDGAAVLVDVDLGWRFWAGPFAHDDGSPICCRALNPYVGGSIGWQDPALRGRIGAGLTLPLTNTMPFGGQAERSLWFASDVGVGFRDGWIASGETMALVLRSDWEWRSDGFRLGVEGAIALMVPVPRSAPASDPFTRYQLFASFAGVVDPSFELGVRVGLAGWAGVRPFTSSVPPGDEAQITVMPFARLRLQAAFVEARAIVFLDDPYGVFSPTSYHGFSVAVGLELL